MPFDEFCQKVFEHFGFADVTIFEDGERARNVAVKHAIKTPGNKGKRRRKLTDPAKALRPKDNEGGWQWFTRIADASAVRHGTISRVRKSCSPIACAACSTRFRS